jgi:nucleoside-triphosphatase THEP1
MTMALLVGDRHAGKTSACARLAALARSRGLTVGGIIAPAVYEASRCVGYDVVDLATGCSARLATADPRAPALPSCGPPTSGAPVPGSDEEHMGRFRFSADGLALGRTALARAARSQDRLVIVDEVGPLELAGHGWASTLDRLANRTGYTLLVVRRPLVAAVVSRWNGPSAPRYDLEQGVDATIDAILRSVET